jgi:hypothetical protein
MEVGFPADRIAPFVGALVSRAAPCTGETFMVGGGRAARVVLAEVPGVTGLDSISGVLDGFDQVMATDGLTIPRDAMDELALQCHHLGIDLSSFH